MKTRKRVLFESKELKIKIYLNSRDKYEILLKSANLKTLKDKETEFSSIILKSKGLEVLLKSGKKMIFLFSKMNWFVTPKGETEFKKAFLFGDVELSVNGELLQNYAI
jgi:hypothetical protein